MNIEDCRRFYAEEIRYAGGIRSDALIEAFARVPREYFLGSGPWELGSPDARAMSAVGGKQMSYTPVNDPRDVYHNVVIALDKAADINNGQPSALAAWINALDLKPGARAYHLGCGVGYYTAIIAEVVGPHGTVLATEVNPDLAARAKANLTSYPNVTVNAADGGTFDPGACDAIFINAGMTHPLPLWLDRLNEDGRLVIPLTMAISPHLGMGIFTKIIRRGESFSAQIVSAAGIYSCTSARDPEREPLIKAALTNGSLLKMKSVRRDAHDKDESCIVHAADVCISSLEIPS
ncbi:MAG TPA: methyltransferase domain-containing protein [Verrucomicrobiae bacterium]|jgi:protein-L-isoaspartate(D-aspartate) O-methyltransferase|nr:methyltransferase domain-containing protein [Verrucomicrobiae bacterium]